MQAPPVSGLNQRRHQYFCELMGPNGVSFTFFWRFWLNRWRHQYDRRHQYFTKEPQIAAFERATDHPNPLRIDRDRSKRNPASLTISRLVKKFVSHSILNGFPRPRVRFKAVECRNKHCPQQSWYSSNRSPFGCVRSRVIGCEFNVSWIQVYSNAMHTIWIPRASRWVYLSQLCSISLQLACIRPLSFT